MAQAQNYTFINLTYDGMGLCPFKKCMLVPISNTVIDAAKDAMRFPEMSGCLEASNEADDISLRQERRQPAYTYHFQSGIRPDHREPVWWADTSLSQPVWHEPIRDMFGVPDAAKDADAVQPSRKNRTKAVLSLPPLHRKTTMNNKAHKVSKADRYGEESKHPQRGTQDEITVRTVSSQSAPHPIPGYIRELANHINSLPRNERISKYRQFPSRNALKKDAKLAGEVSRKTGCLRLETRGGKLRRWFGDERLFPLATWAFLTGDHALGDL